MSNQPPENEPDEPKCALCNRGREACQYCYNVGFLDFEAMCDCGLFDLGYHLIDCMDRLDRQWVIAGTHEAAGLLRASLSGQKLSDDPEAV